MEIILIMFIGENIILLCIEISPLSSISLKDSRIQTLAKNYVTQQELFQSCNALALGGSGRGKQKSNVKIRLRAWQDDHS